ncbi:hypothetical protein CN918_28450 [Priestia megaterium]|nr:hypothetical protein CN918_28450 [Priestia megaterium]
MEMVLVSIVSFLFGIGCVWLSIFGKKKEVKEFADGPPIDILDLITIILYRVTPSPLKRVVLFVLGVALLVLGVFLLVI